MGLLAHIRQAQELGANGLGELCFVQQDRRKSNTFFFEYGKSIRLQRYIKIVDIMDRIEQVVKKKSPLWGLLWSTVLASVWMIWRKHNHRWRSGSKTTAEDLARSINLDLNITFRESKFQATHRLWSEAKCWATRLSLVAPDRLVEAHNLVVREEGANTTNDDQPNLVLVFFNLVRSKFQHTLFLCL